MKIKPHLFFDFDGLKFDTIPALVAYINKRYKIACTTADMVDKGSHLDEIIKKYRPKSKVTWDEVYKDIEKNYIASIPHQEHILPMEGMCEVMYRLSKKYTLWTVTARQNVGKHVVQHLLDKHIPNCITGIHHVWKTNNNGLFIDDPKKDFIERTSGDKVAFIDDSPNEIIKVQPIIPSYLFDPDNLHNSLTDIQHRVHSWKQIEEVFL